MSKGFYEQLIDATGNSIYTAFNKVMRERQEEIDRQAREEKLFQRIRAVLVPEITNEVLKQIRIQVIDEASPVIKDIKNSINGLFS